jgi:hypothetical protein
MQTYDSEHLTQDSKDKILKDFINKLVNNQKDIPEDIQEIVNEHFWELLY